MFRGPVIFWLTGLAALTTFLLVEMVHVRHKDVEIYHLLVQSSRPHEQEALQPKEFRQTRKGSIKEGWITQEKQRLRFTLMSDQSQLVISRDQLGSQLKEQMEGVRCLAQEGLYQQFPSGEIFPCPTCAPLPDFSTSQPTQKIRYVCAEQATYFFGRSQVVANKAHLSQHYMPGHTLVMPSSRGLPLMEGFAEELSFRFKKQQPQLQLTHFEATLDGERM